LHKNLLQLLPQYIAEGCFLERPDGSGTRRDQVALLTPYRLASFQ
jgi:hypothetical protein